MARQPESKQQPTARWLEPPRTGLVGILSTGRGTRADLPPGGLDPPAHPEVLLAAVAHRRGSGTETAESGRLAAEFASGAYQPRGVAYGPPRGAEYRAQQCASPLLRLSPALGSCGAAEFNRRMRKTACPVVWESDGAQSPSLHPIGFRLRRGLERRLARPRAGSRELSAGAGTAACRPSRRAR